MERNVLLSTDVYKMGHMEQYAPGTERVYSYLCARSNKEFDECLFFGLQYYLRQYFSKAVTHDEAEEFMKIGTYLVVRVVSGCICLWPMAFSLRASISF